ncbi:AAA family ATPase [Acidisphaera sp. S103]|uniref:AAA family ATPase n=1 Tax=Acidisphaera sp. S103 TaxID=1747223 RepID=UPI00131D8707|nr:AAA family ATPase [Acidisphaera sp. S103]
MTPRLNTGKGVTGAVRYVFGPGRDPKTNELKTHGPSRVAWVSGQGFAFAVSDEKTADLARRVMEFSALNQTSRTRQCEQDCVHLSIAWRPGETPDRAIMEEAAREALKYLGMENARAIFVAHNDEDYHHVHIVASKINPATGRAYDLAGSWRTLSRWAQDFELRNGGVICGRRQDANELRAAIANRDADGVLEALTRQRSTFTQAQLHRALEKEILGAIRGGEKRIAAERDLVQFERDVLSRPQLIELSNEIGGPTSRYTTQTVLRAEMHVLAAAGDLAASNVHGVDAARLAAVRRSEKFRTMTGEQDVAFRHATDGKGLAIIDGQAGTGKSYTIAAIREAYEGQGYNVIGLAPTNAVAQDMRLDGFSRGATVHSELFALNQGRTAWTEKTAVVVDEAAMLDTKLTAMVTAYAAAAGAKLILVGDDRQLSSIDRGGMFGALKDRHGAAALSEVKRQHKNDDRRAAEMMAEGNFNDALNIYDQKGAIRWTRTQGEARAALIEQWAKDSAADRAKSRFVFAYTNADVSTLNAELRAVRKSRGELGEDHNFETKHGRQDFAPGDRIQFSATDKKAGIVNGAAGRIAGIEGDRITVSLDGRGGELAFDATVFADFRHGYAGTIYRGQGRTLDQTYLYHSEHWRSAASYVALTRHRDKAELFVARNTAKDVATLARQMARTDDKRAASMFHPRQAIEPARELSPTELLAEIAPDDAKRAREQDREPKPEQVIDQDLLRERFLDIDGLQRERRVIGRYDDLTREGRGQDDDDPDLDRDRTLRR